MRTFNKRLITDLLTLSKDFCFFFCDAVRMKHVPQEKSNEMNKVEYLDKLMIFLEYLLFIAMAILWGQRAQSNLHLRTVTI